MSQTKPTGTTPKTFFSLGLEGCTMTDAMRETRLSYSTIHAATKRRPSVETAITLQRWSRMAGGGDWYISASKTLGVDE